VIRACTKCRQEKPLDGFHKHPGGPLGRHSWCKPCANAAQRGIRKRKDTPGRRTRNNLWSRYRMRPADYDALLAKQGGLCAICKTAPARPVVDHCHETGAVRGILCHRCNIGLPYLEREEWSVAARAYLGRPV
jgi:hypothetical protein